MNRLIYQVYVGNPSKLYDWCTASVRAYCQRHGIDYKVQKHPILRIAPNPFTTNRSKEAVSRLGYLPIFEKENAFTYFGKYDQVAIIDSDIFIREDAPNIFDVIHRDVDFAGVLERDLPMTKAHLAKVINYSRMQYHPLRNEVDMQWNDKGAAFYNMGMMVMNKSFAKYLRGQSPAVFLNRLEFQRFIDGVGAWKWSTDQTLLNWWIKKEKMATQNLPWQWNALYTAIPDNRLADAHFIHFYLKDKLPNRGEDVNTLRKLIQL